MSESPPRPPLPPSLRRFRELELEAEVKVTGRSMEPVIWNGARVRLRGSCAPPAAGDVIAFWDGQWVVVHRVERVEERAGRLLVQARGDANPSPDAWCEVDAIVGRVVELPEPATLADRIQAASQRALAALANVGQSCGFVPSSLRLREQAERDESRATVSLSTTLRPRRALQVRDLEEELLVHDEAAGKVHVLNRTAREIFLALDGATPLAAIAERIGQRHGRNVGDDVAALAVSLLDLGLLEEASEPCS